MTDSTTDEHHLAEMGLLDSIYALSAAAVNAETALYDAVACARDLKISWERIARALGVTRSAACQRFSKPPRGRLC